VPDWDIRILLPIYGGDMKPIIFSGEMVRAILDGRKTMTRRVIKPQPKQEYSDIGAPEGLTYKDTVCVPPEYLVDSCPYGQVGSRLWVREAFYKHKYIGMLYSDEYEKTYQNDKPFYKKTPSIFMPKHLARIMLEITEIRVERLQDINITDIKSEGMRYNIDITGEYETPDPWDVYADLWDSINGKKHPWSSNPWVWVISFKVMKGGNSG